MNTFMERVEDIVQVENLYPEARWTNTNRGRVYALNGVAPTVHNYAAGGNRQAKIILEYEFDSNDRKELV